MCNDEPVSAAAQQQMAASNTQVLEDPLVSAPDHTMSPPLRFPAFALAPATASRSRARLIAHLTVADRAIDQVADDGSDADSAVGVPTDEQLSTSSLRSSIYDYHQENGRMYHALSRGST